MNQRVTVAKIGGAGANVVQRWFDRWEKARVCNDPAEWSTTQWTRSEAREMARFLEGIGREAHRPPTLFFCQYLDFWSSLPTFTRCLLPTSATRVGRVVSGINDVLCYRLPDGGALVRSLRRALRTKHVRQRDPELRLYVHILIEAAMAWDKISKESVIIVVREPIGGTVGDDDVIRALAHPPRHLAYDFKPRSNR